MEALYGTEFVRVNVNAVLPQEHDEGRIDLDRFTFGLQESRRQSRQELIEYDLKWNLVKLRAKIFPQELGLLRTSDCWSSTSLALESPCLKVVSPSLQLRPGEEIRLQGYRGGPEVIGAHSERRF